MFSQPNRHIILILKFGNSCFILG